VSPAGKGKGAQGHLDVYIVDIQHVPGREVEQYWIDGSSRKSAIRAAARFAGVGIDKVLSATRHIMPSGGDQG
jgi:hypothetical protein